MAKSLDAVDMESPIPTMEEVISVKDATIVEKENLLKELKQKDEAIQRIGRLLDEANEIMNKQRVGLEELKKVALEKEEKTSSVLEPDEEEDEDVEKNSMKMSTKIVEKSPKVKNELVKVIEKSGIIELVKALKRSTCWESKCGPSPTLDRNEKVEQYRKVKDPLTHCLKFLGKEWCRSLI
ncbi:hypothetical protein LR48_Vigan07g158700 [Vigna angularis]|uniref:Uncharacterized protein n=1 Tax=Phaseolus angularis TaxID=3914 RepID=A0A0L9UYM0_PHAAN|nr:hypothetical protein LR48_Vigan07g158700 [Vigna angularis]